MENKYTDDEDIEHAGSVIGVLLILVIIFFLTDKNSYSVAYTKNNETHTHVFDKKPTIDRYGCASSNGVTFCNVISMEKITLGER